MRNFSEMDAIRRVLAAMYLAGAYTAPEGLSRPTEFLSAIADDPQTSKEAARVLRIWWRNHRPLPG
jgi:hypothetical protein